MRRILKVILWALGSILALILLTVAAVLIMLTPGRLTPLVNSYADNYLEAGVTFDTVDLLWWEEFPMVTLKLTNAAIISDIFPERNDTLLKFDELKLSADVLSLMGGSLNVRRVGIRNTEASLYIDSTGRANYDIVKPLTTAEDSGESGFVVNVDRMSVSRGARIVYRDDRDSTDLQLNFRRLALRGRLTNEMAEIGVSKFKLSDLAYSLRRTGSVIEQSYDSIVFSRIEGLKYMADIESHTRFGDDTTHYRLGLDGIINLDSIFAMRRSVSVDSLMIQLNDISLTADGSVALVGDSVESDLRISFKPLDFGSLLKLIPYQGTMPFTTDIRASIDTRIKGRLSPDPKPRVELLIDIDGGSVSYPRYRLRLDSILFRGYCLFDPAKADSTGLRIDTLSVMTPGIRLHASGTVFNALHDPKIDMQAQGSIDLDTMKIMSHFGRNEIIRGKLDFDGFGRFRLSDLTPQKIDLCDLRLRVTSPDFTLVMPSRQINIMFGNMAVSVASSASQRDTVIEKGTRIVRASFRADTAHVEYGGSVMLDMGGAKISARSAASKYSGDTTVIHPFAGSVTARSLRVTDIDSSQIRVRDSEIEFRVMPLASNKRIPKLTTQISARHIGMRTGTERYSISRPDLRASALLASANPQREAKRRQRLDSLQRLYPTIARDSLLQFVTILNRLTHRNDESVEGDLDLRLDDSMGAILRKWDVRGCLRAASGRIVTPYLPIENRVRDIDIDFDQDKIDMRSTKFRFGESTMTITGRIGNLRRALLGRGKLDVNIDVEADTLNLNQLIIAANQGAAIAERQNEFTGAGSDEELQIRIDRMAEADGESGLVVIPSNIEARIRLNAGYGLYSNLILEELRSDIQMKDRCLQLSYVLARTNSGDMTLSGIYATKSRDDITFGLDVELNKIQVDKFIALIPEIDSIYPMLRSFEGVLDCQMAATAALDTAMNVKLETLRGACNIKGEDMVLLDGETFTEISKMLKFKNRKRNLIDTISVSVLLHDSKIETFPFVLQMDRYRVAMSGVHKLDMSFDYHISVLKSPLPFRLGVDIFGTMDRWDFRIGQARYKSENVPSYIGLIEDTRLNLRRKIYEVFNRGVQATTLENLNVVKVDGDTMLQEQRSESLNEADSLLLRESGIIK